MRVNKSKRYYKELYKAHGIVVDAETNRVGFLTKDEEDRIKKMRENFNVKPGMSAWVDTSDDYKKEYFDYKKRMDGVARRKASKEREGQILDQMAEGKLKERVAEMEKKLFGEDKEHLKKLPHMTRRVKTPKLSPVKKKKPQKWQADAAVCNFVDRKFFDRKREEIKKGLVIKRKRPEILLISDVCGWAWWNKSKYLQMYLADDFEIDVICTLGPEAQGINRGKYDLYLTYGYSYVSLLQGIPKRKRMTGITAHRSLNMLRPYMSLAKHCHANSLMLYKDLKQVTTGHHQLFYVPNGVDEEIFYPIKPLNTKGDLVAGHVGKECPAKGQKEFIFPAMEKAKVKSIRNMNDYRNRRPFCEMGDYYQDMDVFLVASVEDGTPNPALEAAACGRPIISNRIGNMPEFIIDGVNGFLVDRKVGAYVEKLNYLRNNRDHLVEMGKNARKTIEEGWTWKIQAEGWRKAFKAISELK